MILGPSHFDDMIPMFIQTSKFTRRLAGIRSEVNLMMSVVDETCRTLLT